MSQLIAAPRARIEAAGRRFAAIESASTLRALLGTANATIAALREEIAALRGGSCAAILDEVAAKYGVSVRDLVSERRPRSILPARREAMYRCVVETSLSLPTVGRAFRRDHTTIGEAVMRHHLTTGAPLPRSMNWKPRHRKREGA